MDILKAKEHGSTLLFEATKFMNGNNYTEEQSLIKSLSEIFAEKLKYSH